MSLYIDLHIEHGDVVLDVGLNPSYLTDRAAIAQDIVHAILDTGLAHLLISDRGTGVTADTQIKLKLLVEDDVRIMPAQFALKKPPAANGGYLPTLSNLGSSHQASSEGIFNGR